MMDPLLGAMGHSADRICWIDSPVLAKVVRQGKYVGEYSTRCPVSDIKSTLHTSHDNNFRS